jgi:hypothetical protein
VNRYLLGSLALLSMLIVCSALLAPCTSTGFGWIGVRQGDLSRYSIVHSPPVIYVDFRANKKATVTDNLGQFYETVRVNSAAGTIVSLNFSVCNSTNKVLFTSFVVEFNITQAPSQYGVRYLVMPNLAPGDRVWLSPATILATINGTTWKIAEDDRNLLATVNETMWMTFAGYNRTVNFLNLTYVEWGPSDYARYWWDRSTGLLVKFMMRYTLPFAIAPPGVVTVNMTLVSTTVFEEPADSALYVGAGMGIAATIIAAVSVVSRRQRK